MATATQQIDDKEVQPGNRRRLTAANDKQFHRPVAALNRRMVKSRSDVSHYIYDGNSNRLTNNRLTRHGDTTYAYDANGNRNRKTGPQGTTTYTWDSRNRLTGITAPNGSQTTFRYDAFGNLLSQQAPGPAGDQTTRYLTDDLSNVVRQTISTGDSLSILTGRSIDDHLAVTDASGTQSFIWRDALNSTIATTDASGAISQTFSYEPYGQSSTPTTTTFPIQYTGRLPVSDGLYYYRARSYDPIAGRFLSEDPIGLNGGVNLYAYVGNKPLSFNESLGLAYFAKRPLEGDAYWIAGGGVSVGVNPDGSAFISGRLGLGAGGGVSFSPSGTSPGYSPSSRGGSTTTSGAYAEVGVSVGPASVSIGASKGSATRHYADGSSEESSYGDRGIAVSLGDGKIGSIGLEFSYSGSSATEVARCK